MSKYSVFRYESYQVERKPSGLTARFKFSIPPDISFSPEVHFEGSVRSVPDEFLNNAIFHLGLIESFSYWKATASPLIEVHSGSLTDDQIHWWEDLLLHGMGEFFYRNDIDFNAPGFVKMVSVRNGRASRAYPTALPPRSLLTIGGG